jgi:K+-sensing histidine kinase KdpD
MRAARNTSAPEVFARETGKPPDVQESDSFLEFNVSAKMARDNITDSLVKRRSWSFAVTVSGLTTLVGTVLRLILTPLIANYVGSSPFTTFYPAVLFSAWFSGFRASVLCTLLSTIVTVYFFTYPQGSFRMSDPVEQTRLLIFLMAGFGVAFLSRSKENALRYVDEERLRRIEAEFEERKQTSAVPNNTYQYR